MECFVDFCPIISILHPHTLVKSYYCWPISFQSDRLNYLIQCSGTLMALTNTAATLPGIIVPIFVGTITHGNVSNRFLAIFLNRIIIVCVISFVYYTANHWRLAGNFLRYHCIVHHRNHRLHSVRFWRRTALESWPSTRNDHIAGEHQQQG